MKFAVRAVALALFAGLAGWLWTVLFPSPEKIVLKKISQLAASATLRAGDGNLTRAGKAASLAGLFAPDAEIAFDVPGVGARTWSGREEIRETAMGEFASLSWQQVAFRDASAQVGPDRQTAEVTCIAQVSLGNDKDPGIQGLHFELKRIDGDWLITRAETVKPLQ